jgi:hypothetical protein
MIAAHKRFTRSGRTGSRTKNFRAFPTFHASRETLLESRSAFGGRGIDSREASVIYGRHALETTNRE